MTPQPEAPEAITHQHGRYTLTEYPYHIARGAAEWMMP